MIIGGVIAGLGQAAVNPPSTSADFKNGTYEVSGSTATFGDIIMPSADWGTVVEGDITAGVGLEGSKFPTAKTALANTFIASGVTAVFEIETDGSGSQSCRLEFFDAPDFNTEFYVLVEKSGHQSAIGQPSGTTNLSGNIISAPGSHKAAMTILINGRLSLSVDGSAAETVAWSGSGSAINTIGISVSAGTTLKKVSFLTVQADGDLPALST